MKKITFSNQQCKFCLILLILALLKLIYHYLDKTSIISLPSADYLNLIGYPLLVISIILLYYSHNFIKHDHQYLVLKINKLTSKRISFNSIRQYELDEKNLKISLLDQSTHKFNLKSVKSEEVKKLENILDEYVHEYL